MAVQLYGYWFLNLAKPLSEDPPGCVFAQTVNLAIDLVPIFLSIPSLYKITICLTCDHLIKNLTMKMKMTMSTMHGIFSVSSVVAVAAHKSSQDIIWLIKITENNCFSHEIEKKSFGNTIVTGERFLKGNFLEITHRERPHAISTEQIGNILQ